ncbi:hypothetical protein [Ruegeria sp. SCP11]|uniref:hypothetical protein n=1 Tax=Ruegeria sp. SCP11 TaxID=3141378 RepID=UPI00147EFCE8
MADRNTPKKHSKSGDAREERLKAALKANMARRKAQAKARAASEDKADKDEG